MHPSKNTPERGRLGYRWPITLSVVEEVDDATDAVLWTVVFKTHSHQLLTRLAELAGVNLQITLSDRMTKGGTT